MNNYNFTDLILLVGTNPLPNLVTAKYFIKNNYKLNKIWFIYSEHTENYKDKLIKSIENIDDKERKNHDQEIEIQEIQVLERSHDDIQKKVKNLSEELNNKKVHLNYTCGTKSMVVHTYLVLKEELKDKVSFSYLNPENFKIEFDGKSYSPTSDLRSEIKIDIDELSKLHNYEKTDNDNIKNSEIKDKVINVFSKYLEAGNIHSIFYTKNEGKDGGYFRKMFENDNHGLTSKFVEINKDNFKNFEPNESFKEVLLAFEKYNPFDENWLLKENMSDSDIKFFCGFIDGSWLEYYIYKILKEEFDKDDFKELGYLKLSSKVYKLVKDNHDMEIDLTYIIGYQLFGISCTTSPLTSMAKSKGFEIIQRTKQIGGDEAKSILITTMNDTKKLKESLTVSTGTKGDSFLVLGLKDLKKEELIKKIREFIFPAKEGNENG